ncbi:MAG: glycosyltransferase family 4 protein [Nanoarchaeota archaeon]|nr:glycosyltransferase family 4 protein [Nanoarchaeota archaeon]
MKKLKIALVIPTHFDIYSSLNNLLKVYRYLMKNNNIEVTIFTDKKNNIQYKNFKIEKINDIDYNTILEKILFVLGIPRFYYTDLVEKLKGYDVIESSNPEFYMFAYQSYKAARKYKARLIYRTSQTVEGFYLFKLTKYIVVPIMRNAYAYANALLFTNPKAEERCIRLGLIEKNSKKVVMIGHATDTNSFRPLNVKKEKRKTILLSVGGLYKIKGHHLIIKALKRLIKKGCDVELWIVGDGYYKDYLKKLTKKLNIKNKVKFLGKKNHQELAKIYNMSDIFVLANYQEITPAVNEAMACGKPVVAMECGGCDFVIPNKDYGLVTKRFDIDDMTEKIQSLIKNKQQAKRIAKRGRQYIIKNFSVKNVAEKIYKSFK